MTLLQLDWLRSEIIPYQELLGNYDFGVWWCVLCRIIPYQELLGNYDKLR